MQKSGKVTLQPSRVPQKKKLTMSDFFTTFVEANWCLVIGMYLVVFIFSWAFFGTVWFAIFWLRSRFDSGVTCVDNVDSWTSAFLLSVETQTTIGYGGRQVWRSCSSPFLHFHANWSRREANTRGETCPSCYVPYSVVCGRSIGRVFLGYWELVLGHALELENIYNDNKTKVKRSCHCLS